MSRLLLFPGIYSRPAIRSGVCENANQGEFVFLPLPRLLELSFVQHLLDTLGDHPHMCMISDTLSTMCDIRCRHVAIGIATLCLSIVLQELLPISFAFEVPLTNVMALDSNSPVIARLQQQYGVTVTFKQRPRNLSVAVIVRGTGLNVKAVKEATIMLQEHVTGSVGVSWSSLIGWQVSSDGTTSITTVSQM